MLQCTADELLVRFLGSRAHASEVATLGPSTVIEELTEDLLVYRTPVGLDSIRPGGMVSGPMLMGLIDVAGWMVTVAHNDQSLDAVTTDMTLQFLRPAPVGVLTMRARPLRIAKRCVIDVDVHHPDVTGMVAHGVVTFAPFRIDQG